MEEQVRALLVQLQQTGIRATLIEDDIPYITINYALCAFSVTIDEPPGGPANVYTVYGNSRPNQSNILALLYQERDVLQYLLSW